MNSNRFIGEFAYNKDKNMIFYLQEIDEGGFNLDKDIFYYLG